MKLSLARRAEEVLKRAKARRLTLATVESCTAGSLGLHDRRNTARAATTVDRSHGPVWPFD